MACVSDPWWGVTSSALKLHNWRGPAGPLSHCVMQAQDEDVLEETKKQSRRSGEEKKEGKNIDEQQIETSKLSRVQWAAEELRGEQTC